MKRQKSCLILFLFYGGYMLDNQLVMTTLTLTSVFTLLRTHLCNEKGTYPSPGRSRSSSPRGTPSPSRVISTLSLPTSEKQITSRRPPIANFRWKTGKQLSHPPPTTTPTTQDTHLYGSSVGLVPPILRGSQGLLYRNCVSRHFSILSARPYS